MMAAKKEPKRFRLTRFPYWIDHTGHEVTRAPEPDHAEKIVEVLNVAELEEEAKNWQ
jgi:hypothetical protein